MALPSAEIRGSDIGITVGGNLVGGRTGGSLVLDRALLDVTNTSDNKWRNITTLQRSWRVPFQGIYVDNSVDLTGCASLKIVDSGGSPASIEQLKTVTLSVTQELLEIANCGNSDNRAVLPGTRSATISFTADYQDPGNSNNQAVLFADWEATAPKIDFDLELGTTGTGGTTYPAFTGSGYVTSITIDGPRDGIATISGTIEVTGAVTFDDSTSGSDTGLAALIAAIIPSTPTNDPASVSVVFGYDSDQDGTMETSATRWSGTGYVTTLEVSMAYNEISTTSIEVTGTGALTRATS